jgi:hypothetical protein
MNVKPEDVGTSTIPDFLILLIKKSIILIRGPAKEGTQTPKAP